MKSLWQLKSAVREFYDSSTGETLDLGKGGRKLDGKRYYIIKSLFDLIFKTDFANEELRICLLDYNLRPSDVYKEIYRNTGVKLAQRTCINKVTYSMNKIEKLIGENVVVDTVDFTTRDIEQYYVKINTLLTKYKYHGNFDVYDLNLSSTLPSPKEVSMERLEALGNMLRPYLYSEKAMVLEELDTEALAYMKYLYSLDESVDDRKIMIKALIGLPV